MAREPRSDAEPASVFRQEGIAAMPNGDGSNHRKAQAMSGGGARRICAGKALEQAPGVSGRNPWSVILQRHFDRVVRRSGGQRCRRAGRGVPQYVLQHVGQRLSQQAAVALDSKTGSDIDREVMTGYGTQSWPDGARALRSIPVRYGS